MSFESFLHQGKAVPKWRRITYAASLAFHVALLTAGIVHSFWHVDELTPPNVKVAFMAANAPPPPPPPAAKKKVTPTKVHKIEPIVQPKPNQIIQPKIEKEPEPEEEDEGVEGGVEGGVAGGVVGGMVGAPVQTATLLPPRVGAGQLISDVQNDPRFRPGLPPQLNRAGMVIWGLFKICVSIGGAVTDVKTIKAADPLVDGEWIAKIKTWQYRPYSINGRPVPYCYPMRLEVRSSN